MMELLTCFMSCFGFRQQAEDHNNNNFDEESALLTSCTSTNDAQISPPIGFESFPSPSPFLWGQASSQAAPVNERLPLNQHDEFGKNNKNLNTDTASDSELEDHASDPTFYVNSVLWKPKKRKKEKAVPDLDEEYDTSDELQRHSEFLRRVKKMDSVAAERAWDEERKRRQKWASDRRKSLVERRIDNDGL
ncbi:hypothetical protein GQ43DRAFT_478367 [Delitschia confertaspora ATCC 74209]|uniref:Uncharacterized protein n=1 Tax=Delitschia confertaspora ATCC 74209 TaxID=1513339 RepID=A0A9P4MSL4_9PLEO|nr:hypothetical protein GQ43DRAFT_478367 [Delitschia confertaspora ATCC 74209]